MDINVSDKYESLKSYLYGMGRAAVAFSGGVDSTFLLKVAYDVLGKENVLAVIASTMATAQREIDEALEYCKSNEINYHLVNINELMIEGFCDNKPNRCYLCKRELFGRIIEVSKKEGLTNVVDGTNADDINDFRPGMIALSELGVISPLKNCGFSKEDIRTASEFLGLKTFKKPSYACLATRFPYGEVITESGIERVGNAEQYLKDLGFGQLRVRCHGNIARIELTDADMMMVFKDDYRDRIYDRFKEIGFDYVSLDLKGYRTGSMNEVLTDKQKEIK